MDSQFDVTLEDVDLANEVELMVDVIIAVSEFDRHLTDREVDQILHVNDVRFLSSLRRDCTQQSGRKAVTSVHNG